MSVMLGLASHHDQFCFRMNRLTLLPVVVGSRQCALACAMNEGRCKVNMVLDNQSTSWFVTLLFVSSYFGTEISFWKVYWNQWEYGNE